MKTGVIIELKAYLFYYPGSVVTVASWKWPRAAFPNSSYTSVGTCDYLSLMEPGTHSLLAEVVKK